MPEVELTPPQAGVARLSKEQESDLWKELKAKIGEDESIGGRFERINSITAYGKLTVLGLVLVALVSTYAFYKWSDVGFVLDASRGDGFIVGPTSVCGFLFLLIGLGWFLSDPNSLNLTYFDKLRKETLSSNGYQVRAGRALFLLSGKDSDSELDLDMLIKKNPGLNGRFVAKNKFSAVFAILVIILAGLPISLGMSMLNGAEKDAVNMGIAEYENCEFQNSFFYECEYVDIEYDIREIEQTFYCEDYVETLGHWLCTDVFGRNANWENSSDWTYLTEGGAPEGIDLAQVQNDIKREFLLGFSPQNFTYLFLTLAILFGLAPFIIGIYPVRFEAFDNETQQKLGKNQYRHRYGMAVNSGSDIGDGEELSEMETLAIAFIGVALGLAPRHSILRNLLIKRK